MDFARKQLEKYGWTDGKGLGKHENGISEALKPKLKRSVTGVGHDAAAEFTEHWWTKLYNTAASNVEVKEKNGKTKKIKTKDDDFEITNTSWSYKKKNKSKSKDEYTNFFVKTSILTSGGDKTEDLEDSENEIESENNDIVKLTDEQLFAACEGRTAHKGARHGLKALGKLARIEMQEQMLLHQSKYNGYSQAKNKETMTVEDVNLLSDCEEKIVKKKKKKKKHCSFSDTDGNDLGVEKTEPIKKVKKKKTKDYSEEKSNDAIPQIDNSEHRKIKKKKKRKSIEIDNSIEVTSITNKKCKKNEDSD